MAVVEASFNIEIDSTSSGLIFAIPESYGTPSTTYKALLLALIEPNPLTLIIGLAPGDPEPNVDWTPGAEPTNAVNTFALGRLLILST